MRALDSADIETVLDNERLFVARRRGSGSNASVVAFAGIQHGFGGVDHVEFARSLSRPAELHDTYFVLDKRRTWYNDVHDEVVEVLTSSLAAANVYLLGNSMGGFGALVLDGALSNVRATVAFVPQYSVVPGGSIQEHRWHDDLARITNWRYGCVPASRGARRFVFFGADEVDDRPHIEGFLNAADPNTRVYSVQDCGHDVARYLREAGLLHHILDRVINEDASHDDVSALIDQHV